MKEKPASTEGQNSENQKDESALHDTTCSSSDPLRLTLEEAITILAEVPAVIVGARGVSNDRRAVHIDDLWSVTGEEDAKFLTLAWEHDGRKHALVFEEGDNREVLAVGSSLFLVSTEGEEEQLTVLMPRDIIFLTNAEVCQPEGAKKL